MLSGLVCAIATGLPGDVGKPHCVSQVLQHLLAGPMAQESNLSNPEILRGGDRV